jgi:hypothetical protein
MSERKIVTARRSTATAFVVSDTDLVATLTANQKLHLAYQRLLSLNELVALFGTVELAKKRRERVRKYIREIVNNMPVAVNGETVGVFLGQVKFLLQRRVMNMTASPQAVAPMQVSPPATRPATTTGRKRTAKNSPGSPGQMLASMMASLGFQEARQPTKRASKKVREDGMDIDIATRRSTRQAAVEQEKSQKAAKDAAERERLASLTAQKKELRKKKAEDRKQVRKELETIDEMMARMWH